MLLVPFDVGATHINSHLVISNTKHTHCNAVCLCVCVCMWERHTNTHFVLSRLLEMWNPLGCFSGSIFQARLNVLHSFFLPLYSVSKGPCVSPHVYAGSLSTQENETIIHIQYIYIDIRSLHTHIGLPAHTYIYMLSLSLSDWKLKEKKDINQLKNVMFLSDTLTYTLSFFDYMTCLFVCCSLSQCSGALPRNKGS